MKLLYVIWQEDYENSVWGQKVYILIRELKRKKIQFKIIKDVKELDSVENAIVAVIEGNRAWRQKTVDYLYAHGMQIIVMGDGTEKGFSSLYNSITVDFHQSASYLNSYLSYYGKKRVALLGINQNSGSDLDLVECFYETVAFDVIKNIPIVYNNLGLLEDCINEFYRNISFYDTVICANDFVALKLADFLKRNDPEQLKRIWIIAFNNLIVSGLHSPSITSFSTDYEAHTAALINIYNIIAKQKDEIKIHMRIKQKLYIRETTEFAPPIDPKFESGGTSVVRSVRNPVSDSDYFGVNGIDGYSRLERMFTYCNRQDFMILKALLEGESLPNIALKTFSSHETVKYRIRKMTANAGLETRAELLEVLRKCIDSKKLNDLI